MRNTALLAQRSRAYSSRPDRQAEDALVRDHLHLVRKAAWQVSARSSSSIGLDDLMQIGIVALIEAAASFVDRGIPFAPYAMTRVRGAMIDELRKIANVSRLGMAHRRRLSAVRSEIERERKRAASDSDMMKALSIDEATYYAMVDSAAGVHLDPISEIYSDQDWSYADPSPSPSDVAETLEDHAALRSALGQLGQRDAMVLHLIFVEELNLHEIGEVLNVGAARVCQIKKAALGKLRAILSPHVTGEDPWFPDGP